MAKRVIQQRRGRGTITYRCRPKAYVYRLVYPSRLSGEGIVQKLVNSTGHSAPLARVKSPQGVFFIPAFKNMYEGQKINFDSKEIIDGNFVKIKDIPVKTKIYCIESNPGDGGKFVKAGGTEAVVSRIFNGKTFVMLPSKKEKEFNPDCRAIIGVIAGTGRKDKPVVKAGKMHYIMTLRNKLWPRTSAIKMNAIDHPFGSGRGKNPKSKIAKRNAPPGARVGLIRPRRTGKRK